VLRKYSWFGFGSKSSCDDGIGSILRQTVILRAWFRFVLDCHNEDGLSKRSNLVLNPGRRIVAAVEVLTGSLSSRWARFFGRLIPREWFRFVLGCHVEDGLSKRSNLGSRC